MYRRRNKNKIKEPIIEEVVEQKNHIDELNEQEDTIAQSLADEFNENKPLAGLENNDQPQYSLQDEITEERPNVIINRKSQILIGDNKGVQPASNNSLIYGEFESDSKKDYSNNKPIPRTLESLTKKEHRHYLRTGRMPQ
ncbi:MAG: hypothetical protein PF487_04645 [Bacteroidales bacterium]|jgi:hypothetical protein|nr:hypothetical protein [Bacteroidales bacterium]